MNRFALNVWAVKGWFELFFPFFAFLELFMLIRFFGVKCGENFNLTKRVSLSPLSDPSLPFLCFYFHLDEPSPSHSPIQYKCQKPTRTYLRFFFCKWPPAEPLKTARLEWAGKAVIALPINCSMEKEIVSLEPEIADWHKSRWCGEGEVGHSDVKYSELRAGFQRKAFVNVFNSLSTEKSWKGGKSKAERLT